MKQGQAPRPHCSSGNWSDVCLLSDASSLMMALRMHVTFQSAPILTSVLWAHVKSS